MADQVTGFDISDAKVVALTYEEALEVGFLGVKFNDDDLTLEGVNKSSKAKAPEAKAEPKAK